MGCLHERYAGRLFAQDCYSVLAVVAVGSWYLCTVQKAAMVVRIKSTDTWLILLWIVFDSVDFALHNLVGTYLEQHKYEEARICYEVSCILK